jgi:uncharacterized repeat protein (TIGR03803 family)
MLLFCVAAAIPARSQTFTTLASFDGTNGSLPYASLVQGLDGNLYGTTADNGSPNNHGTVFSITSVGTLTELYSFCALANCADGTTPTTGLVLGTDGNFYGTTQFGGANCESSTTFGCGTVYKISPEGTLTTIYSFCSIAKCKDGQQPSAALIQATDGSFYGTTYEGGVKCPLAGTAFKITPQGSLTTIFSFCRPSSSSSTGKNPVTPLVQGTDGNFYGTTSEGGLHNKGTIFQLTPDGHLTTLYSFCMVETHPPVCSDGQHPSGLIQGADGNFYGTTESGGPYISRKLGGRGTIFKITPSGTFATLYNFCSQTNCTDGATPVAPLVQASDGSFYGTTQNGGKTSCGGTGCGTIYKVTPEGSLTTLYTFCSVASCADGSLPQSGLMQAADGNLYGTTYGGGTSSQGTVFQLSIETP